jgi:3-oxoadipate enol-lactonase
MTISKGKALFDERSISLRLARVSSTTQGELEVGGTQLYYEECGSGSGVVLLHDGLLHSAVWDDVFQPLCGQYHVLRYDRRGYGRSEIKVGQRLIPFGPEDDLLRLMEHVRMQRAVLVGSSSGTALATDFALAHPERVEALFLIGPVVHGMRSSDYFLQRGNAASAPLANNDIKAVAKNWSEDRFQVSGDRPEVRKRIFNLLVANPQNLRVSGQFEIRPSPPTVTRLEEVQAPTLVLVGEGDIADVHAFAGAIQAAFPVVRREVWKDCGHLIQLERPTEVVSRIQGFISLAERKTISLPAATLRNYEGKYAFGNSTAQITLKSDRLVLQLSGDADIPLFAESDSLFFVRTTGTEVQFEQSATGPAVAMIIRSPGGNPIRCPRI